MILEGNQRGGGRRLAQHLMNEENEHVEIHEMRGFVSGDLDGAFQEIHALSRATKCKQCLFSLSLNPPSDANVPAEAFEDAADRAEAELGLTGQPRVIVFHEKSGPHGYRRHAHVVWSRIEARSIRAIPLPFTKKKLMTLSRELYIRHGWTMPRGMVRSADRNPLNYTLAQWQQAKRGGKQAADIKSAFLDCWAISDGQQSYAAALKSRGYLLARGDRGRIVAVDAFGEVYAVAKWTDLKARDVRAKVNQRDDLPSVEEAREAISEKMTAHLARLQHTQNAAIARRMRELQEAQSAMTARHRAARRQLDEHAEARTTSIRSSAPPHPTGWRKLWRWISGQARTQQRRRQWQLYEAEKHAQEQKDELIFAQLEERGRLERRMARLRCYEDSRGRRLDRDMDQYRNIQRRQQETFKRRRDEQHSPEFGPSL